MGIFKDLTGQKFGKLTVIKYVGSNKNRHSLYLCKCDCNGDNSEKIIRGISLSNGATQSCGCIRKENTSKFNKETKKKYNTYDLTGEFGIGYTEEGEEFYFDLEDYDKIKNHYWGMNKDGYLITGLDTGEIIQMHRLIMGFPENMQIDHIYHINHDNRKSELRIATNSQNGMNKDISKNNTSGVKGVNYFKATGKWRARIVVDNKEIHLGYYDNFNVAVRIRKLAEKKYFGAYNYKKKTS